MGIAPENRSGRLVQSNLSDPTFEFGFTATEGNLIGVVVSIRGTNAAVDGVDDVNVSGGIGVR